MHGKSDNGIIIAGFMIEHLRVRKRHGVENDDEKSVLASSSSKVICYSDESIVSSKTRRINSAGLFPGTYFAFKNVYIRSKAYVLRKVCDQVEEYTYMYLLKSTKNVYICFANEILQIMTRNVKFINKRDELRKDDLQKS